MKITKDKKWYQKAFLITTAMAWVFCVLPTLIAGMAYLPEIATRNAENTLTGSFTVVLICCIYPLYKGIVKLIKSPSAPLIMWILFFITLMIYRLAQTTLAAMVVIFFVAAMGNTIGAVLFFVARKFKTKLLIWDKLQ